jgi:hypothetical protein
MMTITPPVTIHLGSLMFNILATSLSQSKRIAALHPVPQFSRKLHVAPRRITDLVEAWKIVRKKRGKAKGDGPTSAA